MLRPAVTRRVEIPATFEAWQAAARALLIAGVEPSQVVWAPGDAPDPTEPPPAPGAVRVPARFIDLAREVARHSDPARWQLLYTVLWRLRHDDRDVLGRSDDPDVRKLLALHTEARRGAPGLDAPAAPGAAPFVPAGADLAGLRQAASRCTGCDLYRHATRTVFGQGPADARIVLVGEQPGDQEDRRGAPFVGPAGEVLDRALAEVGLARERLYVTNAVKHFKFVDRGRRRIHQTPHAAELAACRPWLEAELAVVRPGVVVCLGATAARALLGPEFRLMRERGRFIPTRWAARTIATLHPSAVLRGADEGAQANLYRILVEDLRTVARAA
jgi:uracil-DNA glycosylase